jgi:hypothetical protein
MFQSSLPYWDRCVGREIQTLANGQVWWQRMYFNPNSPYGDRYVGKVILTK